LTFFDREHRRLARQLGENQRGVQHGAVGDGLVGSHGIVGHAAG
jgi:hypothetical protein